MPTPTRPTTDQRAARRAVRIALIFNASIVREPAQ